MNLGRSAVKLFVAQSGRALLLFAGITYFSRVLTPGELGAFFLFKALLGLLSIPADFGVRGAVEKRLSEGDPPTETLGSALVIKLVLVSLVALGILLARSHINDYIGADLAVLLVVALVVTQGSSLFLRVIRGELRVGEAATISFTWRLIWVGAGAVLVNLGYGLHGVVYGQILGAGVALLWGVTKAETRIGAPSMAQARSIMAYSKYQWISGVGGRVYQWLDIVVIGFFLAGSFVSAYEIAWQVTLLVLLASNAVAMTLFPQVSQWDAASATDKIEGTLSTALGVALFVSIPALVGGTIFATEILSLVFSPEYAIAGTVLVVLLVEKLFQSVNDIIESSVRAIDKPELAAKATVITVALNLVLNPVLVVSIGFVGAAIATTVSGFFSTVLHARYLSRFITIDFPIRLVGWYAFSSLVMGAALVALKSAVPVTSFPVLAVEIGVGAAIYLSISVLSQNVRDEILHPGLRAIS